MKPTKNIAQALEERRLEHVGALRKKISISRKLAAITLYFALWAITGDWLRSMGALFMIMLFSGFYAKLAEFQEKLENVKSHSFLDPSSTQPEQEDE